MKVRVYNKSRANFKQKLTIAYEHCSDLAQVDINEIDQLLISQSDESVVEGVAAINHGAKVWYILAICGSEIIRKNLIQVAKLTAKQHKIKYIQIIVNMNEILTYKKMGFLLSSACFESRKINSYFKRRKEVTKAQFNAFLKEVAKRGLHVKGKFLMTTCVRLRRGRLHTTTSYGNFWRDFSAQTTLSGLAKAKKAAEVWRGMSVEEKHQWKEKFEAI